MMRYVSSNPRSAYVNYRDLDFVINGKNMSFMEASVWGSRYLNINFRRLAEVKTEIDPSSFFKNEQSIPTLSVSRKEASK